MTCIVTIYSLRPRSSSGSLGGILFYDAITGLVFMICNMMINLISIPHNFSLEYDHEGFTLFLRAWTMFYPTVSAIGIPRLFLDLQRQDAETREMESLGESDHTRYSVAFRNDLISLDASRFNDPLNPWRLSVQPDSRGRLPAQKPDVAFPQCPGMRFGADGDTDPGGTPTPPCFRRQLRPPRFSVSLGVQRDVSIKLEDPSSVVRHQHYSTPGGARPGDRTGVEGGYRYRSQGRAARTQSLP
ncbi:hypothetical protein C8Q76DRAFT_368801 [Earliella scabrosa]|nr:hypothetical protein C8Q76DRAFT_368801 [Earliella scabrosa]